MRTTIYRDKSGFNDLASQWDTLLHNSQADTIFLTHMWQTTWWRHLGEGDLEIVAVHDTDNTLVGISPLFRAPDLDPPVLSVVGCVDVSDYLDWIAIKGQEEAVFGLILDALDADSLGDWRGLVLCNILEGSPTLNLLPRLAGERGWQVQNAVQDVVPHFRIPESWEAYEQLLPGKARRELRRKLRRAGPYSGVDWYLVGPEHDLDEEIDAFIDLLVQSHPEKAGFMDQPNRSFFHAIGRATYAQGQLQLAFLTLDGKRIATYMNFLYGDRIMVYNSGLDPAAHRISPGIVLMAHLIRRAIEEQACEIFDFLRGDEPYKYQLGGIDAKVHQLYLIRP
jgi:CelD/BcsL family acetyltransferase involved in cellulose biosynthesis